MCMRNDVRDEVGNRDFRRQLSSWSEMQRNLFQQAVRMHGQDLSILTEKLQQGNFVFIEKENEEHLQQQLADHEAKECDHRESSANDPDTTAVAPYQDGVHLTGTMRDLVRVQSRTTATAESSTEESSKSDTSPEILPLGVPRELHEPFQDLPPKLLKNNGFVSKLHNFISKKADLLFKATPADKEPATLPSVQDTVDLDYYATLPPLEQFMVVPPEQSRKRLFDILAINDIIAGSIVAIKDFGMFVQVVCLFGKEARYLQECDIVGLLPKGDLGERYSLKAQLEDFRAGNMVRCRVVKTDAANEKVILTMINQGEQNEENLLGIINESELPVHYRRSQTQRETQESYDEMLDNTLGFDNSYNVSCLTNILSIDDANPSSLIPGLQSSNFSTEEHAEALRKWQSHKWAMESVARGVEHFKASRYLEAMQQLNRALEIDAENVEGLVARGALFANQNNLSKAIKDFAEALRIRPSHKNANRYMCQTLYEKGKQCEENGEKEKARDCYQSAVDLTPDFQDALVSLQRLEKPSRRSVREKSEVVLVESSSEESSQEQMSAKQLREMISDEKSSTKKKKKKDKPSKGHEDGKGDRKVKKELKMGKKKKKKKLRKRSSSLEVISKQKQKESSSDSESESSEPPSPVPKRKDNKKGSKGDNLKEPQSPEGGRPTGRKRSRNGSLSPKRKSRSKTRKADLIRKKSKHASGTSSSEDDKLNKVEPKKDKRNHSRSLERSDSSKTKRKSDMNRSRKESESSSFVSSSEEEQYKKTKKESKKEGKDRRVKEEEVSHKKRKMKTKKEKVKRTRSSSSVFEESADSLAFSPMRKKSKPAKKVKKMHKKAKKRSESVSSLSASGSDSERKPSPTRKVPKKKKKNKKKKPKKKERSTSVSSPSVLSSESPERPKSPEEPAKKMKHMKKTKEEDDYSDGSSSDSSSSSMQQKISKEKRDVKTRITDKSPARSDRRSRSASLVKKERAPKVSSDEGEEVKIGKKRSRSSEYSVPKVKDHPKKQSAKEAIHSPPNERQGRKTSDIPSAESEEEHTKKKDGRTGRKRLESPEGDERPQSVKKEKTRNKAKVDRKGEEDRSSRRSKRHSRAQSPDDHKKERSASRERNKQDDKDRKKSKKSRSPASLSPHRKETSEDSKQGKLVKQSEYSGERSVSKEKNKADDKDNKKQHRSYSSASESSPNRGFAEDRKQEKSDKHSKTREESPEKLSKSSRRSRSLSPRTKKEEEKEQRTPIRERKRKRSGSFIAESSSLETARRDRKSRDSENDEEKLRHRKESEGETRNRHDSSQESSHRSKSADNGKDKRKESPKESKKSHSKHSPSPPERKNYRRRSKEEAKQNRYSRSSRSTSADVDERKQRSKSGSYDRDKDKEHDRRSEDKDRDGNRRESKEGSRRKSGSLDREGHTQERRLSDGDRHQNSEDSRQKSSERERPRSREEERKKEKRDTERRTSHEAKKDDRDKGRDRSKEGQYYDLERPGRGKSRERERSKERERRDSGKTADSSRERRDKSRENEKAGSRSESSRGDKKVRTDSSKENGKGGTKGQESQHHQSLKVAPTLNVEDIPMPPENAPVAEAKKEPSPILYVTSSSCKDDIIKVKSKWDTDSEDDESGPSGPSQNRRGGGGRGSTGSQRSYMPSSQHSGSNGSGNVGGGQNHGGYHRCEGGNCLDITSASSNSLDTPQSCLHLSVLADQSSYHEPLRLRGGCVASPPPKYESDYSDSDVSFSSSGSADYEEPRRDSSHEGQLRVGRRQKSSSSDRSSGERSKKRFKQSSRRESRSSSRSSTASSSGSQSSRSSSRSDISYSSRSHSRSPSSSRSSSSLSHRSYSSNSKSSRSRDSSKEPQSQHDEESSTERSDSEGAGAYNLFDSWETYMDSKGHDLGKQVPSSNRNQRTVKLEAGGSTVGKHSRRPDLPFLEQSDEEDQENSGKTDGYSLDKNNEDKVNKTAQIDRLDGDNVSIDKAEFDDSGLGVTGNESESNRDAAENQQSRSLEDAHTLSQSSKSHTSLVVEEVTYEERSRKRDGDKSVNRPEMESSRAREYGDSSTSRYSQEREYGHRAGHGYSGGSYRDDRSSAGRYSSQYGNQLNVGHSHTYMYHHHHHKDGPGPGHQTGDQQVRDHRRDRYKDERHYRSDRSYGDDRNHSRHTYPQQEGRRDHHRRSERGFESHRYGRREHSFRKRRDDDDWGRGVTEVQERGTFLGLVTKSKEALVSQLYSVCSTTLELVRSEHRQWWL
ncbi:filaggrin isoform X2 [Strongylocentrotus purpuratus]|uniref:S1 motif domain-containing protein n=1 Tax=Strongylocentrotus purpuratus TaxID=7668 RepID=A0A7M7SXB8_STRPU|nr:filaggrin isoform X2 [Strongylocentrotus purpuratus]